MIAKLMNVKKDLSLLTALDDVEFDPSLDGSERGQDKEATVGSLLVPRLQIFVQLDSGKRLCAISHFRCTLTRRL
jgi:hypothetical protein